MLAPIYYRLVKRTVSSIPGSWPATSFIRTQRVSAGGIDRGNVSNCIERPPRSVSCHLAPCQQARRAYAFRRIAMPILEYGPRNFGFFVSRRDRSIDRSVDRSPSLNFRATWLRVNSFVRRRRKRKGEGEGKKRGGREGFEISVTSPEKWINLQLFLSSLFSFSSRTESNRVTRLVPRGRD